MLFFFTLEKTTDKIKKLPLEITMKLIYLEQICYQKTLYSKIL